MTSSRWRRWTTGGLLVGLLLLAYVTVWRPARAVLNRHVVHPILTAINTERARTFDATVHGGGLSIILQSTDPTVSSGNVRARGGILFLLPALFLVVFFPYRPYWLYFWGFHLALWALQVGVVASGVGWTDWGFVLNRFLRGYVVQGLSLAFPIFALYLSRSDDRSGSAATGHDPP